MTGKQRACAPACEGTQEKLYPVCRIGQTLMFVGIAMAFLSFIFGFWIAMVGALLVLIGFLVVSSC